jgi:hypothetical protein
MSNRIALQRLAASFLGAVAGVLALGGTTASVAAPSPEANSAPAATFAQRLTAARTAAANLNVALAAPSTDGSDALHFADAVVD